MVEKAVSLQGTRQERTIPFVGMLSEISVSQFAQATGGTVLSAGSEQTPSIIQYGRAAIIVINVSAVSEVRDLPPGTQLCRIYERKDWGRLSWSDHFFRHDSRVSLENGKALILTPDEKGLDFSWIEILRRGKITGGQSLLNRFSPNI